MNVAAALSKNRILILLLLLAAAKSVLWVMATPPWRAPDEFTHFGYIQYLSREQAIPLGGRINLYPDVLESLERTNMLGVYGEESSDYDPEAEVVNNAGSHPPLYYALMLPAYWAASPAAIESQLYAVRLFSSIIGILTIWVAYRLARLVFPRQRYFQIGLPMLLIFLPQLAFISAGVMSDSLLTLLFTWFLYQLVVMVQGDLSYRRAALAGLAAGLGMLTKSSFVVAYPVALAVFAGLLATRKGQRARLLKIMAAGGAVSLLVSGWFYLRNYVELGGAQPYVPTERYGATGFLGLWLRTGFRGDLISSFLGNFSWLSIPLPIDVMYAFRRLLQLAFVGAIAALAIGWFKSSWRSIQLWLAAMFAFSLLLFFIAVSYFELKVGGAQGRYLFPVIFPMAALMLVGLTGWMPPGWRPRATAVLVAITALFSVWALLTEFLPRVT